MKYLGWSVHVINDPGSVSPSPPSALKKFVKLCDEPAGCFKIISRNTQNDLLLQNNLTLQNKTFKKSGRHLSNATQMPEKNFFQIIE